MAKIGGTLRNVFIWTYPRGTIPYDIICALILLFIFLTPRACFFRKTPASEPDARIHQESPGVVATPLDSPAGDLAQR
jgi:hypothetical protein